MNVRLIAAEELTADDRSRWLEIQQANPLLDSPYFCPEFTLAVAASRRDVKIAILEDGGKTLGYFPFQRGRLGCGRPVGFPLADFQGVVIGRDVVWTAEELLKSCALKMWDYDHVIASQEPFGKYHRRIFGSPYMDLSAGFESYTYSRPQVGPKPFDRLRTLSRKLEREVGELNFEWEVSDPGVLQKLLSWKSDQYRASGGVDILNSQKWARRILKQIYEIRAEHFAGILSALYAGGRLVAAHFGMCTKSVWHWWFPAYDPELSRYSPGLILLLKMAEAAESLGMRRIDLGKGGEPYKQRFMSGTIAVAEGYVALPSVVSVLRKRIDTALARLRMSPLGYPVRKPGRLVLGIWRSLIYG